MSDMLPYRSTPTPLPYTDERSVPVGEAETGNFRDYWIAVRKYRWTIVAFLLPIVAISAISIKGEAPVYTATIILYIENQPPNITGVSEAFLLGNSNVDYYYKTQLNLLKSRSLVAQVIRDLGLDHDSRFTTSPQNLLSWMQSCVHQGIDSIIRWIERISLVRWIQESLQRGTEAEEKITIEAYELGVDPSLINLYLERFEVSRQSETQLLKVEFSSFSPSLARDIVNAHVSSFIRTSLLTRFEVTGEARKFLEEKVVELKAQLGRSEEKFNSFRKDNAIVGLEKGENFIVDRLRGLNTDLTQARSKRIELESLHHIVQQRDNRLLSQIIDNPVVQRLKDQLSMLEQEKARRVTIFKPTHPEVSTLQQQIDQAKNRMDQEIARIVRSIALDYQAAKTKEAALIQEMEQARQSALDLREKAIEAAILEREVESNRTLYENVLKRTKETELTGAVPISNIRVVDRAETPLQPDNMHGMRNILLSVLVGLLGGVGLACLRHRLDNTLKTPEDVERSLPLPTLGMVPDVRRLKMRELASGMGYARRISPPTRQVSPQRGEMGGLITSFHPWSIIGESIQTICAALLFSLPERPPRTILITSSQPQEGKTIMAINIAVTLAGNGAPVLLIDADLRNGNCHKLLGVQNRRGLTNLLTGEWSASQFIRKTAVDNLSFLCRGELAPNAAALLGSEKMGQTLESLKADFAFIIIDSAPVLPIADTVLLSTKVDGVLLVVGGHETSCYLIRRAYEQLAYVKAKVLGVVLNKIDLYGPEYKQYKDSFVGYYKAYTTDVRSDSLPKPILEAGDDQEPH